MGNPTKCTTRTPPSTSYQLINMEAGEPGTTNKAPARTSKFSLISFPFFFQSPLYLHFHPLPLRATPDLGSQAANEKTRRDFSSSFLSLPLANILQPVTFSVVEVEEAGEAVAEGTELGKIIPCRRRMEMGVSCWPCQNCCQGPGRIITALSLWRI